MPYISPSHTSTMVPPHLRDFGSESRQLTSNSSRSRLTSPITSSTKLLVRAPIMGENIHCQRPMASRVERSQTERNGRLHLQPVSELKGECHTPPNKIQSMRANKYTIHKAQQENAQQQLPWLHKESGELVKSSFRSSNKAMKSGLSTVRFHSQLEHTRLFLQNDMPISISENLELVNKHSTEAESESLFCAAVSKNSHSTSFLWEVSVLNFPVEAPQRLSLPVRVESISMSLDNTELVGSIVVANIAFCKSVIARYTMDDWKTISNVKAEFNDKTRQENPITGYDRFNFKIKLADEVDLDLKVLLLAVKYCVNDQEYWDNNSFANFQIKFKKKPKSHKTMAVAQHVPLSRRNWPPRNKQKLSSSTLSRPQSIPAAFNTFANAISVYESNESMQLTSPVLKGTDFGIDFEDSTPNVSKPQWRPFSTRYNFDKSISAAIHGIDPLTICGCQTIAKIDTERPSAVF